MVADAIRSPYPYFGGKSAVASLVWQRLGDVRNFVEPFFGSGAVTLARPHWPFDGETRIETVNDADGFVCVAPETRLLAGDLTWKLASEIGVGDSLIGFDEHNGPAQSGTTRRKDRPTFQPPTRLRRWCETTVTAVARRIADCYRLTFEDGTTVVCSAEHQWLAGKSKIGGRGARWIATKSLRCDSSRFASHVMKLCDVVHREESFDSGWLGGFYDGEGHIKGTGSGWSISVCQKHGPELDRCEHLLIDRGFCVTRVVAPRTSESHKPVSALELRGGMRASLRFLMMVRPQRLLKTAIQRLPERSIHARERQVIRLVKKEFLGLREVVSIETDSHTFVAEGLASHNCNFWRALQREPDTVAEWADWPVNEIDMQSRHLWLVNAPEVRTLVARLREDPDAYDCKIAGWWVWGICQWIGSGWCHHPEWQQRPHLGDAGRGIHRPSQKRPHLGNAGREEESIRGGCEDRRQQLAEYFALLADRMRPVRVCCGDWSRVCGPTPTVKQGLTGVFLDPPYNADADRKGDLYAVDDLSISHAVRDWCIEWGTDKRMRIVLAGYMGEGHEALEEKGWEVIAWKSRGGYGSQGDGETTNGRDNARKERLWCSPHCLSAKKERRLFDIPA